LIGSRVSHYRIVGRLDGEGAGAYRAEELGGGGAVLLFFVDPGRSDGAAIERFRRAAAGAAALQHPNIAEVREIGPVGGGDAGLYLALPLFEGQTLESLLARGPVPVRTALDLAAQISAALARAHSNGITHGGLRPSCVLITSFGEVKVAAFGLGELLAASLDAAGESGAHGAQEYCAPEVLGGAPPGPRSDVWSLGVLVHEMIAGRHPFAGQDERERIAAILGRAPEPLPAPREGLSPGLARAVARCLAHRPDERYPDAGPLETDLLRAFSAAGGGTADLTATRREMPSHGAPGPPGEVRMAGVTRTPGGLAGRKLPSYRIFERLGSGGMAVVYRAEDTRLERTVALKFLAPELSRDPGSKARFLREARAASALDHPNLCTIHEIGSTEDGRIFIAMPYYGGESLAQRIARGPLAIDAALDVAVQVAQGLAKAHRHGIVHRDVKPANLMLTSDGVVKIVDFGLAKLMGTTGSRSGLPAGTIDYISPEQARGDEVDPRTDLWSLGVVLYEMVSGRRPFGRENEQAVLYAILREAPAPLADLCPDAPPGLIRVLDRLLQKDPARRTGSAESAAAELRAVRGPETPVSRAMIAPPVSKRRRRWRVVGAAGGVLASLLLLLGVLRFSAGGSSARAPAIVSQVVITDPPGRATFPSLSRDGSFVVYALEQGEGSDIVRQRIRGSNPENLTADSAAFDTQPAISPDGSQIAFRSDRDGGGIFVMGATGESVRRLADFGYNPAWSPDGREVVCSTVEISGPGERRAVGQLWRLDAVTGERRRIATGDAVQPSWSPHGGRIAYWGVPAGTSQRVLWTIPADGGEPVAAVDDDALNWSPAWSPDGRYLYYASDHSGSMNLWRIPIDEESGRPRGAAQALAAATRFGALPSVAGDGIHIVFAAESRSSNLVLVPFDPQRLAVTGPPRAVIEGSRVVRTAEMSPAGDWIVFGTAERQEDLFLVRPDGSGLRALTSDAARDRGPHWSADGTRVLFYSDRSGRYEAWTAAVPQGSLERVTAVPGEVLDPLRSPDGRALVYGRRGSPEMLLDLGPPLASRVPRPLPLSFAVTSWSADGAWLAGSDPAGIALYSFAARRVEVLPEQGDEAIWLRDGRTLLFLRGGSVFAVDRLAPAARRVLDPPRGYAYQWLSVGPGDRTLVLVRRLHEGYLSLLTLR
jgi:eukaryotic-like serine/threonine-protein kinase